MKRRRDSSESKNRQPLADEDDARKQSFLELLARLLARRACQSRDETLTKQRWEVDREKGTE